MNAVEAGGGAPIENVCEATPDVEAAMTDARSPGSPVSAMPACTIDAPPVVRKANGPRKPLTLSGTRLPLMYG
jgi:hypothetical protein